MSIVTLVSGGLDSTLVAVLAREEGLEQYPLFVDYGQRAKNKELAACRAVLARLGLPDPKVAELGGFGSLIRSGLTDPTLRVLDDAFTPGRNLLFLLLASAYAAQRGADAVSIGLLHEDVSLFPDQTNAFLVQAEANCYDNAAVETFFKTIKAELIWRRTWETRRQAETAIFQYINGFYNPRRRHSALGGKSPLAFERQVA